MVGRTEFDRQTLDGDTGFSIEIPYLEHACGVKHFVMDKVNGKMMAVYDGGDEMAGLEPDENAVSIYTKKFQYV